MADAIHRALHMPLDERRERWRALDAAVREQDIAWWRRSFLDALDAAVRADAAAPAPETAGR